MADDQGSPADGDPVDWNRLERIILRFENAWERGQPPAIEEFLPSPPGERFAVLVELIHADLEYRLRSGLPARLESYVERFAELSKDEGALLSLIEAEISLRRQFQPPVDDGEYLRRFPGLRDRIVSFISERETVIPGQDRQSASASTFHDPSNGHSQSAAVERPEDGVRMIERYQLVGHVASGSFADVYKAYDTKLKRCVALKIPKRGTVAASQPKLFLEEARAAAQLKHRGIVAVHDTGISDGVPFIVSEFIEGQPLSDRIVHARPTFREAALLCEKVARSLDHAHRAGFVHRDVKPANIIVDRDEEPRLTDFGLAELMVPARTTNRSQTIGGTPAYMAPEQDDSPPHSDARTDVYALGVTLFELLTGDLPFRGTVSMVRAQVRHADPPGPRQLDRKIPFDLETICLKCLRKNPRNRYQTAAELADDLRRWQNREPIKARPVTSWERSVRWCQRNPGVAVLAASMIAITLVGLASVSWEWREAVIAQKHERALRGEAERALRSATAFRLATESRELRDKKPALSLLLGVEAIEATRKADHLVLPVAHQNLRDALFAIGGTPLAGHTAPIYHCATNARGNLLVTAGEDKTARLWDLADAHAAALLAVCPQRSAVTRVAVTNDGRFVITATAAGETCLWRLSPDRRPTGPPEILGSAEGPIDAIALSPDGRWLATAGADRKARLWDLGSANIARSCKTCAGHTGSIRCVLFGHDSHWLFTGGDDASVRAWDLSSAPTAAPLVLEGLQTPVLCLSGTLDGKFLVACSDDGTAACWDLKSAHPQKPAVERHVHNGPIRAVAITPDGNWAITGGDDATARRWNLHRDDASDDSLVFRGHSARINSLAVSPEGSWMLTGSDDCTARLWRTAGPTSSVDVLKGHSEPVSSVAITPDCLITASYDGTVRLWRAASGHASDPLVLPRKPLTSDSRPPQIEAARTADKWLVTGSDQSVGIWDLTREDPTEKPSVEWPNAGALLPIELSPDGKWLASVRGDKNVALRSLSDLRLQNVPASPHPQQILGISFSPDSQWLAVTGRDGTIRLWRMTNGMPVNAPVVLPGHEHTFAPLFSPDGAWLVSETYDDTFRLWSLGERPSEQVLGKFRRVGFTAESRSLLLEDEAGHLAISPIKPGSLRPSSFPDQRSRVLIRAVNGGYRWMLTENNEGTCLLWNLSRDDPRAAPQRLPWPGDRLAGAALGPDDRWIVAWGESEQAHVWQLAGESTSKAFALKGLLSPILTATFSHDGPWLAAGARNGAIYLWDLEEPGISVDPVVLPASDAPVRDLQFAGRGRWIVALDATGTVRLWRRRLDELMRVAKRTACRELTSSELQDRTEPDSTGP